MDLKELAINSGNKRHPWELIRMQVVHHFINQSFPQKKELTILDVGSGDTFMIQQLSEYFDKASFFAVDTGYHEEYIRGSNEGFERQSKNIKVYNELSGAARAMQNPIDLVLLLDVIEHVADDIEFLKTINKLHRISDETVFLITVPAFQGLFSSHDVFLGHYRRYNNRLLCKNVRKADLNVIRMGYFFMVPLLFRLMEVLMEKLKLKRGHKTGIGRWNGNFILTWWLLRLLILDFSITRFFGKMGIKLPGLSNFAICKR